MDYSQGHDLWHTQWRLIHSPNRKVFGWLQYEDKGEMMASLPNFFGQKVTTPIGSIEEIHEDAIPIQDSNDYTIAFITPDEKVFM